MAAEMDIKVALLVKLPGGLTAVTVPEDAELYDEADQTRANKRCIRLNGVEEPLGRVTNGIRDLRPWVTNYVDKALIYTDKPESLELGSKYVGLTGVLGGDWTKPVETLVADPIAPFSIEGLRKAGLI